jgi:DNA-binding transcriptional LysR family regulator
MEYPTEARSQTGLLSARRMDLLRVRHLKLLQLVATTGSLTAAAQLLRISQPASTKMLQELERAVGCSLVDRSVRGGTLSAAGHRTLERMRIALGALDAVSQAGAATLDRPLVRIGMLPLVGVELVPRMVAVLSKQGRLPRLTIQEHNVAAVLGMLRDGVIDCVIGRIESDKLEGRPDEFRITRLMPDGYAIACAPDHPLARKRRRDLALLREQGWIVAPRGTHTRQVFEMRFASQGLQPPLPEIECSAFHTNLATVSTSALLTIAPQSAVQSFARQGRVRQLDLEQPFASEYLVFMTLRGLPELPAVGLVRETLQAIAGAAEAAV